MDKKGPPTKIALKLTDDLVYASDSNHYLVKTKCKTEQSLTVFIKFREF